MALTARQIEERGDRVTASILPPLMAGDRNRILNEWQRIVGVPDWRPEDLSDVWPVQLGSYLEAFVLNWQARKTGAEFTRRGEVVTHPERPYFCCTLDAYRPSDRTVVDVKVVGHWRKLDDVIAYYTPQMVGQAGCVGTTKAALLIVRGGAEPVEYEITWTPEYEVLVWERVEQFWQCCENLTPPFALDPLPASIPAIRIVQMDGNPGWKANAEQWLQCYGAAESAKTAEKALKELVPADAAVAVGSGIVVTRDRAGRLSLRKG